MEFICGMGFPLFFVNMDGNKRKSCLKNILSGKKTFFFSSNYCRRKTVEFVLSLSPPCSRTMTTLILLVVLF